MVFGASAGLVVLIIVAAFLILKEAPSGKDETGRSSSRKGKDKSGKKSGRKKGRETGAKTHPKEGDAGTKRDGTVEKDPAPRTGWDSIRVGKSSVSLPDGFEKSASVLGPVRHSRPGALLLWKKDRACLLSLAPKPRIAAKKTFDPPVGGLLIADLDLDGAIEVVASVKSGEAHKIFVLDERLFDAGKGGKWKEFILNGKPDTLASPVCAADLDGDKGLEVLVMMSTGFGKSPRGVSAFKPDTGREAWTFLTGPTVTGVRVGDVDRDGSPDVVFGSFGPNNGARAEGTDDAHSYVFALNSDGSEKWIAEIPFGNGRSDHIGCRVHLPSGKERHVLASTYAAWKNRPDVGAVLRLDGRTGNLLHSYEIGLSVSRLFPGPNGSVLAIDREGAVHLLDANLKLRRKTTLGECIPNVWKILPVGWTDLNADGRQEFLVYAEKEDGAVVAALAPDLESVLWEHEVPFGAKVSVMDVNGDKRQDILLLSEHVTVLFLK
jgi:hypothetical protein